MMRTKLFTPIVASIIFFFFSTLNAQEKISLQEFLDYELKLNDGSTLTKEDVADKAVLIDFWYRGCFPCIKAIPALIRLQEEFKNDFVIIGRECNLNSV